jgi:hypothetical protein
MPGVIIIVPSVTPVCQRELFSAALKHIGARDLTNTVVEVNMKKLGSYVLSTSYQKRANDMRKEAGGAAPVLIVPEKVPLESVYVTVDEVIPVTLCMEDEK